jgi:hypothetical protein
MRFHWAVLRQFNELVEEFLPKIDLSRADQSWSLAYLTDILLLLMYFVSHSLFG